MLRSSPDHDSRTGRSRVLITALATLPLGLACLPPPALAARSSANINVQPMLEASPQGSVVLCPGEQLSIYVTYSETRYRVTPAGGSPQRGTPESGVEIVGSVQNPSAGRLLNSTLETMSYRSLVVAPFVFKAEDLGDTQITFEVGGTQTPLLPSAQLRLRAAPVTIDVHVGCKFHVVALSHWFLNWGFRPNAMSVVEAILIPDRNGVIPDVVAPVENSAIKTLTLCENGVDAADSDATITSQLDFNSGTLQLTLDYGQVTGTAWIRCPTPIGFIDAMSEGTGEPVTIATRPLSIAVPSSGGAHVFPHVLESDMGPVSGTISIVVVKLPN